MLSINAHAVNKNYYIIHAVSDEEEQLNYYYLSTIEPLIFLTLHAYTVLMNDTHF